MTTPDPHAAQLRARASDLDRSAVAEQLAAAYADGRLTPDELDERLAQAMSAKTFADLVPLTDDLPDAAQRTRDLAPRTSQTGLPQVLAQGDESDTIIGVFGGAERQGGWHAARHVRSFAVFGGVDLDFNEATFEAQTIQVTSFCIFGGMDLKVPSGVNVRNQTVSIFGGSDVKGLDPDPAGPTIILKGLNLFGGSDVAGPGKRKKRRAAE